MIYLITDWLKLKQAMCYIFSVKLYGVEKWTLPKLD